MTEVLQPGVQIKPLITLEGAREFAERLYGIKVLTIKEMEAYDDKNYHIKVADSYSNPHLHSLWPHGFVLKVLNSLDSRKLPLVEAQIELMLHLDGKGIRCTQPVKNIYGNFYSSEKIPAGDGECAQHVVRMLTFQPGDILYVVNLTPRLCHEAGSFLARLNISLADFTHPAYKEHSTIWALSSATKLPSFLYAVQDTERVKLVQDVILTFEQLVIPVIKQLPQGMLHGDFNEHNILVQQDEAAVWHVDGVLDFGDTQYSCYLFEVSLAACYMMLQAKLPLLPLQAATHTVAGYHKLRPLSDLELALIQVCVCTRLCQSLVLGAYSYTQDPGNEYVLQTSKSGWKVLRDTWEIPANQFLEALLCEINK